MKMISITSFILLSCLAVNAQKAGLLDLSFGKNGKVLTDSLGLYPASTCTAAMKDGSIVVGGIIASDSAYGGFFACKYSYDGILDTSFGHKGIAVIRNLCYDAEAIAVQSDDKIIICGYGITFVS